MKDGHKVFLSGANTAWVAYGYDFGNSQYQYRRDQFLHKLDLVSQAGGNSMSELNDRVYIIICRGEQWTHVV